MSVSQVNVVTSGNQSTSKMLVMSDGRILHVWTEDALGDTLNTILQARIFEADGTPASGQFTFHGLFAVDGNDGYDWDNLDLDLLPDGRVVFSYVRNSLETGGDEPVFSILNIDPSGFTYSVSNAEIQSSDTTGSESPPITTVLNNGNILFVWSNNALSDEVSTMHVEGRIYNPTTGQWVTNDFRIGNVAVDGSEFDGNSLSVANLTGGNVAIGWARANVETGNCEPVYTVIDQTGQTVFATAEVEGTDNESQSTTWESPPLLQALPDGRFLATWVNDGFSNNSTTMSLEGRIFNADGTPATGDFRIGNMAVDGFDGYDNDHLSIVSIGGGRIAVAYPAYDPNNTYPRFSIIDTNANGSPVVSDVQIPLAPGHVYTGPASLLAIGSGGYFAAVYANGDQAFGSSVGLNYRIFDASGNPVTGDMVIVPAGGTTAMSNANGFDWNNFQVIYNPTAASFTVSWASVNDGSGTGTYASAPINVAAYLGDGIVHGTTGNDAINAGYVDTQGDQIDGSDGPNDSIAAGTGDDTVSAGAGDDTVAGGAGNDSLLGGAGNDIVEGGDGNDALNGGDGNDSLTGGAGNDTLSGGGGSDRAVFTGSVSDYSFGFAAGNVLIVTDSVAGRDGVDRLDGVEFATFNGVTYRVITGDDGSNTTLQGPNDGTPSLIIAHAGNDWGGGHATSDAVFGGAGNDTLDGGDGNDTLVGEADDDLLRGDGGNDILFGGTGNDTLQGGAGNDALTGGDGRDRLQGGAENDTLTGGGGNDVLFFDIGGGTDTVTDFDFGDSDGDGRFNDQIDVSALDDGTGRGVTVWNTTVQDLGNGNARLLFPQGEAVILEGVSAAALTRSTLHSMGIPCFTAGTPIDTPGGPVPVELLRPGDLVLTRDDGPQPLRWMATRRIAAAEMSANPALQPIRIAAGALGNDAPLVFSQQHALLIMDPSKEERLVRATHLARIRGGAVRRMAGCKGITYVHLMFDRHQILRSHGLWSESFFPGPQALTMLGDAQRRELATLFPDLFPPAPSPAFPAYGPTARAVLKPRELPDHLQALRAAR